MKKPLIIGAAAMVALAVQVAVAERSPSAFQDSNPASLDTRIETMFTVGGKALDSRTGSWSESDFRGMDTMPIGSSIIIR